METEEKSTSKAIDKSPRILHFIFNILSLSDGPVHGRSKITGTYGSII